MSLARAVLSLLACAAAVPLAAQEPAAPSASPAPASAHAQPAADPSPSPSPAAAPAAEPSPVPTRLTGSLGRAFDSDLLNLLPMSDGIWSVFETIESTAILDRMESGGLYVGEPGLMGIRGSSWTQASWTLGDLDITDPDRTGTPLFLADPEALTSVEIGAGLAPADMRGAGPGVRLAVRRPGDVWHESFAANDAPAVLEQAFQRNGAPAIAHIESYASAHFRADGPLIKDRLGLFIAASLTEGVRAERSEPVSLGGHDADVLTQLVFTPTPRDEVRFLGSVQRLVHPYAGRARFSDADVQEYDHLLQAQLTWQRQGPRPWSVTAGIVRGAFDPHLPDVATGAVERLSDGPVQQQFPGTSTRGRWAATGWFDPWTTSHHAVRVGASFARTYSTTQPAGSPGLTPELVGGIPARVWNYGWAGPESKWRGLEGALYAADQVRYGRLSIDAGLRYEWSQASSAGSNASIQWKGLSPRILGRFRPFRSDHLALLAGIARYRYRLPLNLMAYGDPSAPQGNVYLWVDRNHDGIFQKGEKGDLIARVGPGGAFASIDPNLKAPTSREIFVGFETHARGWRLRGLAYHRREMDLVTSVNVGAPVSAYTVSYVNDPGNDIVGTEDDQLLPVYNRRPETFGQDRYLLTNDPEKGTGKGLELSLDGRIGKRIHVLAGGTASRTLSLAGYGGFLATENDQGLVGDRLEDPNAATLSTGRLFFERGYTLKIAGTYVAPFDFHVGIVARYQDGQHFARFIIPTDLNQGPEPVKAISNGASRFTYVLTIDAKIEKGFDVHKGTRMAAVLEAFNLRGTGIEVEENVTWGPYYRTTSAIQPPRALRLGFRLDF